MVLTIRTLWLPEVGLIAMMAREIPGASNSAAGIAKPHDAGNVSCTPLVPAPVLVRILAATLGGLSSIQHTS